MADTPTNVIAKLFVLRSIMSADWDDLSDREADKSQMKTRYDTFYLFQLHLFTISIYRN